MTGGCRACRVRALFGWSAWAAAAVIAGCVVYDGGVKAATFGALAGVTGSFAMLALRVRSVKRVLESDGKGPAARTAFLHALAKLACAFAALSVGVLFGQAGAVGALVGLLTTAAATVGEGFYRALGGVRKE